MIRTLSKEVQAKLRSGIAIFSLQQCVEELVLNSIDAGATCVAVKIDIEACKVQVIDNGSGIGQEDMEKVGLRYCTSKCSSLEDLDNLPCYGFRGEAIASVISLAALVEISSRTRMSVKTFVKTFVEGKELGVFEAQDTRPSAGTSVLICNIFHKMPVRRKRMDSVLEIERIRQRVEAISLMHPSVSFTVKKDCSGTMLVQLPKARNTYYRFVQIHGLARAQKLGEVDYTYGTFQMIGHIGREGHYNNNLQFLFVNSRLLLKTRIHKLLNCLLRKLSSSNVHNSPKASSVVSSPKQRGGADLHGVYVINIKCHYSEYDVCLEPAKSLIEFQDWDSVLTCVEEGVKAFLTKENLVSEFLVSDAQKCETVFNCTTSSPCRNAKTQACHRNAEDDLKEAGTSNLTRETDTVQDPEVQISEQLSSNTESKAISDTGPETEVQNCDDDVSVPLSSIPVLQSDKGEEQDMLEDPNVHDVNDNDLSLSVNNNITTHCEGIRITTIDRNEAQESLRTFTEPNLRSAPKRKIPLIQTQSHMDSTESSAGPRFMPRRKVMLAYEIGSLDKFKRMYGKGVEAKGQAMDTQITPGSCPAVSKPAEGPTLALSHRDHSLLSIKGKKVQEITNRNSYLLMDTPLFAQAQLKCSTSASMRSRTSLAAKLSLLKCDKSQSKKPSEGTQEDTRAGETPTNEILPHSVNHFVDSREMFTDSLSQERSLESSDGLSKQSKILLTSGTNDSVEDDRPDEYVFTAPHGHDPSTPSSNSTNGDTKLALKTMTPPQPAFSSGQIINPASPHDPVPSSTGNEDQVPDERQGHGSHGLVPVSSDWLAHYDDSLGKLVYINKVTGLSKYDTPPLEETSVPCCKDVTNMAISVVSKTDEPQGPGSLSALFSEWNNPVFVRPPQVAVDVTTAQAEGLAVKIHNILFPYRFTKDMIHSMKVIHQVDKKFLACLINSTDQDIAEITESGGNLLVLVDQHAAHERVRLEGLLTESYEDDPDMPGKKRMCSSSVSPPLEISVTEEEMRLLRLYQPYLRDQALEIGFPQTEESRVLLKRLPTCFVEKENTEQRRGRRTIIKSIAEEYLREHIKFLHSAGRVRSTLPLTVHNVLASQACHGAIKFNDVLSKEECCSLVGSLSSCQLPFQCAHGRPSIVPLVDLLHLDDEQDVSKPNLRKLTRMYKAWKLYGKN
ncbi:DNA mismatch repair protein Mlh3 isoform X2 [Hoplias malabaricus]|uniref:DNA mismatch repair protein Mlh3 isoform X2 n=1 Tax=Hoplias malabaricus TaxID=27720 RepID=UPI00346266BE